MHGKDVLPKAGEYTSDVLLKGLSDFLAATKPPGIDTETLSAKANAVVAQKAQAAAALGASAAAPADLLHRLPGAAGVLRASS